MITNGTKSDQAELNSVLRIQPTVFRTPMRCQSVPVLQETVLLAELEARESSVDLKALSAVILNDMGATLEVLRLVGRECGDVEDRPVRMEDCLAYMGLRACLDAMSKQLIAGGRRSKSLAELSSHSREIARHSRDLAEQTVGVDPHQAYLTGLCHSIGSLPKLLGWNGTRSKNLDGPKAGVDVAREWLLPRCVLDYFSDGRGYGCSSPWREIVRAAHQSSDHAASGWATLADSRPPKQRAV